MTVKLEYLWILLIYISLLFLQNVWLSRKIAAVYNRVDSVERILLEGVCE